MSIAHWLVLAIILGILAALTISAFNLARRGRRADPASLNAPADPSGRGRATRIALVCYAIVQTIGLLGALATLYTYRALPPDTPATIDASPPGMATLDMATGLIAMAQAGVFLVAGVLFLFWTYRIVTNTLSREPAVETTPGWAIGWYFVPIVNLWAPFQPIRDAWRVAHAGADWRVTEVPGQLRLWWGLWIATMILDNVSFRLLTAMRNAEQQVTVATIDVVSAGLSLPLILVLIRIVGQLTAAQKAVLVQPYPEGAGDEAAHDGASSTSGFPSPEAW